MSKYSKEFKLQVVKDYDSLKLGFKALSRKYDVSRTMLMNWVYGYQSQGAEYFEKRSQIYTSEFKLGVLQHMKDHHISLMSTAVFFGIPAFTSVLQWQRLYNAGGDAALTAKPRGRPKMTKSKPKVDKPPKTMTQEELMEEVLNLRAERDYLKKLQALIQEKPLAVKNKPH